NRRLVRAVREIEEALSKEGSTLTECLGEHSRIFGPVYRGMVQAGEEGGNLVEVLESLADHLTRSARTRGQVRGAFLYPLFLLLVGTGAVFVLVSFVIPRFQEMFIGLGQELPVPTQLLLGVSGFCSKWWSALLGGAGAGILSAILVLRRPGVRLRFDAAVLRLPVMGGVLLKLELTRVLRTLAALLANGVRVLDALRTTGQVARNAAVRGTFEELVKGVSAGEALAAAAERTGIYPPMVINLIRTGEDTGGLPEMLEQLASIYADEADRAVNSAVRLVEPVLIVVLGGIIAGIVAAVMLPIFQSTAMVR
ncbi:MAG TPA: type II secretion system F family protein, partial [Phycisphaerae bacterium]|nr:type II secretion system F family protein [Phycisphaerae bacterium]